MTQSVTKPTKPREQLLRRQILSSGVAALVGSMLVGRANAGEAQPMPSPTKESNGASATLLDQFAVSQVIARERYARETQDYDMEAACFHPEAFVDVSWFSGTAAEFVETGRKAAARGRAATSLVATYFDALSPPVVWINKDRAIADGSCAVHAFSSIGGVEAHVTSYTRLLWRAQRLQGEWLISGLRGIYIRDTIEAVDPGQTLVIDQAKLATFRPSYRYLSYLTVSGGGPIRNDRADLDRPDLVTALCTAERDWLNSDPQ